jgi:hypothetical protein
VLPAEEIGERPLSEAKLFAQLAEAFAEHLSFRLRHAPQQYALRYDDVNTFLNEVALANPIAGEDVALVDPEDEKIVLSSVHQARGWSGGPCS